MTRTKAPKPVSFTVSAADARLIGQIVDRAEMQARRNKVPFDRQTVMMDLTATHANDCRLDLAHLLAFPDFDFSHDVWGIARHLDRDTGQLRDCFLPRSAK